MPLLESLVKKIKKSTAKKVKKKDAESSTNGSNKKVKVAKQSSRDAGGPQKHEKRVKKEKKAESAQLNTAKAKHANPKLISKNKDSRPVQPSSTQERAKSLPVPLVGDVESRSPVQSPNVATFAQSSPIPRAEPLPPLPYPVPRSVQLPNSAFRSPAPSEARPLPNLFTINFREPYHPLEEPFIRQVHSNIQSAARSLSTKY
ncbi:hypothetical protein DL96DRAFT_1585830 [Flagelloscypha sp. PMI_526]|nr:hypothetical protein DL96DRAFT_1585830 [Flagelloscypha sp. PMI_526]